MELTGSREGMARRWGQRASCGFAVCVLLSSLACAPKQRIPLDVAPTATAVFLDKERLEEMPRELELRCDRDHTLLFKSEGHRSELIVLRSVLRGGKPRLEPADVRLRLTPLDPVRRELVIEGETELPRSSPASPAGTGGTTRDERLD